MYKGSHVGRDSQLERSLDSESREDPSGNGRECFVGYWSWRGSVYSGEEVGLLSQTARFEPMFSIDVYGPWANSSVSSSVK